MKKLFFFSALAAMTLLCSTSCSNDEFEAGEGQAKVNFAVNVESGLESRAISDGTQADKLVYAVFDNNGTRVSGIQKVEKTGVSFPTNETLTLAKGQTYKIVFWAQDADCSAYTVDDNMNLTVDYAGVNNDESRDAFYASVSYFVEGDGSMNVVLKRPFAQINVGENKDDFNAAKAAGLEIVNSSVKVTSAANAMNLLDGTVSGDVNVEYTEAAVPTEDLTVEGSAYKYLSMSYILVNDATTGAAKATTGVEYTLSTNDGRNITLANGLENIPVQRNYRTNILGSFLTGNVTFNITIDPIYNGEYNGVPFGVKMNGVVYKSIAEVVAAVNASSETNFNIDLLGNCEWETGNAGDGCNMMFSNAAATVTINGNGNALIATGQGGIRNDAKVVFNNVTIVDKTEYQYENGSTAWEFTYLEFQGNGSYEFNSCVINNTIQTHASSVFNNCEFKGIATLASNQPNEYAIWVYNGDAKFTACTFENLYRGIKVCDYYDGSEVKNVVVDGCSFKAISKKPGLVIDDHIAPQSMAVTISNSTFVNVQPGDQGLYIYETDNHVPTVSNCTVSLEDVSSASSLVSLAKAGGKAVLAQDVTLDAALAPATGKELAIDLNGHTLTASHSTPIQAIGSKIAVSNGKVVANDNSSVANAGIYAGENGEITFDKVEVSSNASAFMVANNATLTVKDSNVAAACWGIATNASSADQNVTINLVGSTLASSEPLLINVPGTLNVSGSTIKGSCHGVIVRGGTAEIENSEIVLNYTNPFGDNIYDMLTYESKNWGTGDRVVVAALTMGNRTTNAYQYPTKVTLKNTKVTLEGDNAAKFPVVYAYANSAADKGVTFNYDSACTFTGSGRGLIYGSSNITVNGEAK